MIDENWERWIKSSINTVFGDALAAISVPSYYPGKEFKFTGLKWAEIRAQGPDYLLLSGNVYQITILVNIMLSVKKPDSGTYDAYERFRLSGKVQPIMAASLVVKKYGDGETLLLCMTPESQLDVTDWGEVSIGQEAIRADQISIEASYTGILKGL